MDGPSRYTDSSLQALIEEIEASVRQKRFREALQGLQGLETEGRVHGFGADLGNVCYLWAETLCGLGRYSEAKSRAEQAYDLFKSTSENTKVAEIQHVLGRICLELGQLTSAENYVRDAIAAHRRAGTRGGMVQCYNLIARVFFTKSEFGKAIEYLGQAKQLSEKLGEDRWAAIASGNLGTVYTFSGEWRKAEESLTPSLRYHRETADELNSCRALLSLGFLACLRRDFRKSADLLAAAHELASRGEFLRESAIYHQHAGLLARCQGDAEKAESHFVRGIEIGTRAAPEGDINNQTYRLLAELDVAQKKFDDALISCQKSLKVSKSVGERIEEGVAYKILGQIYSAKGGKRRASVYFRKSVSLLQQIGAKYELARTYLEAGRSQTFDYYRRLGFLSDAESLFRDLESRYHVGLVNLAVADLLMERKDYPSAEVFLVESERLFKESKDEKELRQVRNLRRSIEEAQFKSAVIAKTDGKPTFDNIQTNNTEMREIVKKLEQVKDYDIGILLEGETGTGKDFLAKAIHYSSVRKDKRFVPINCAAFPEHLLENELFGHKKGAYTGADKDKPGMFEVAEGGTLYLDQVEEIPMPVQVKLLRAIEEKQITRLGDTTPRKINCTVVSSTIEDLKEAAKNGKFRQDLYFRLNTLHLKIPPVRRRKEDIPHLVKHFLKQYGVKEKKTREFEKNEIIKKFVGYDWPGNVRELDNEIKRMAVLAEAGDKDPADFLSEKLDRTPDDQVSSIEAALPLRVDEFERGIITETLKECNWNKSDAARHLGIPEGTLRSKMKKLEVPSSATVSKNRD